MEKEDLLNSKYVNYFIRSLTDDISEKERNALEKWMAASSDNKIICDDLRKAWLMAKPPVFTSKPDVRKEWVKLEKSLNLQAPDTVQKPRSAGVRTPSLLWSGLWNIRYRPAIVAVAAMLVLMVSLVLWKNPFSGSRYLELITQHGERSQMILSDGSEIQLNAGSMARFRKSFTRDSREVFLTGEAFFTVTKEDRPFIVKTENAKTVVLGTQFNVWARDGETRVVVKSGRVKLTADEMINNDVILQKDQMCIIGTNDTSMESQPVDSDQFLGWLQGKLVFIKTPLPEIIADLERSYNVIIELTDTELQSKTVTATFQHMDIDTVLATLCLTLNSEYYLNNGRFIITN